MVKKPPANTGDVRDSGSIPGSGRFSGGGYGNPLQDSCLGNPMDRGGWWTTIHGVPKELDTTEWLNNSSNNGDASGIYNRPVSLRETASIW